MTTSDMPVFRNNHISVLVLCTSTGSGGNLDHLKASGLLTDLTQLRVPPATENTIPAALNRVPWQDNAYLLVVHANRHYSPNLIKCFMKWARRYPEACLGFCGTTWRYTDHTFVTVHCNDRHEKPAPVLWLDETQGVLYRRRCFPHHVSEDFNNFAHTLKFGLSFRVAWAKYLQHLGLEQLVVRESNVRIARPCVVTDAPNFTPEGVDYTAACRQFVTGPEQPVIDAKVHETRVGASRLWMALAVPLLAAGLWGMWKLTVLSLA